MRLEANTRSGRHKLNFPPANTRSGRHKLNFPPGGFHYISMSPKLKSW